MTFRANHLYGNRPESSVQGAFGQELPLTVVGHIISFLSDDIASLARLCRTSRVLWYMTLPLLWENVTLKSYNTIRWKDEVPEGFGSSSPFAMGLNALVTRNVSGLVRSLCVEGEFCAADLQEHARAGRIAESVMILNIALRAALDQCNLLNQFRWDLDVRIQPNVYAGLAKIRQLESLWLRFPESRSAQPACEIPAMPNLKSFTFTHYDPLCFPDDMSTLLLNATKLENLTMHFSPRMRDQGEPSTSLAFIFRKNIAARRQLRLKSIAMYNLLNSADPAEIHHAIDKAGIEHCTALNSFGEDEDTPIASGAVSTTHFMDRMWHTAMKTDDQIPKPKSLRFDHLHRHHVVTLGKVGGLERLYLVNARHRKKKLPNGNATASPASDTSVEGPPQSTMTNGHGRGRTPMNGRATPSSPYNVASITLRDLYLDRICNTCGPTLRHLILPARWALPPPLVAQLIRSCPNLTQLSACIDCDAEASAPVLRLLVPFLSHLYAIRILDPAEPPGCASGGSEEFRRIKASHDRFVSHPDHIHIDKLSRILAEHRNSNGTPEFVKLKYIGIGWKVFEVGGLVQERIGPSDGGSEQESPDDADTSTDTSMASGTVYTTAFADDERGENVIYRRKVRRIDEADVQHVEIWKMDSLEII
jgi:hypothetical protein